MEVVIHENPVVEAPTTEKRAALQPLPNNVPQNVGRPAVKTEKLGVVKQQATNAFAQSLARLREEESKQTTVHSGWLVKKPVVYKQRKWFSRGGKGSSKSRFFRLTNEALYYYQNEDSRTAIRGRIAFSRSTTVAQMSDDHSFKVEDEAVCCQFEAANEGDCTEWICQLQQRIERFQRVLRNTASLKLETPDSSPVMQRKIHDAVLRNPQSLIPTDSDGSISSISERPSTAGSADEFTVPNIKQAMSTCKKRQSTDPQRMAQIERENAVLRDELAQIRQAAAAATRADDQTANLEAQLRTLQQQLKEMASAKASEVVAGTQLPADDPLRQRRLNIEAHHETCKCNIM